MSITCANCLVNVDIDFRVAKEGDYSFIEKRHNCPIIFHTWNCPNCGCEIRLVADCRLEFIADKDGFPTNMGGWSI